MSEGGATVSAELQELDRAGDHAAMIDSLRDRVIADRRTLADPWVKDWAGRRWRDIFTTNAAADPLAVKAASKRFGLPGTDVAIPDPRRDERGERQRIAERFLHDTGDEWRNELPPVRHNGIQNTTLVFCPGLIGTLLPLRAFEKVFPLIAEEHGWPIICADAHPMRSCEANVADLAAAIERGEGVDASSQPIAPEAAVPPGDVFLLGYSKGAADALTLLMLRPDLAPRVKGIISWGGAIGGSFLADNMLASLERSRLPLDGFGEAIRTVLKTLFPIIRLDAAARLDEYDVRGAVRDLTTAVRAEFMEVNGAAIDALDIPIFNITGATRASEVPYFQVQGYMEIANDDPDNDMQVTQAQAKVATPMATDLAALHAHHWDISYDPFPIHTRMGSPNLDHQFPRRAAITACFELLAELGVID